MRTWWVVLAACGSAPPPPGPPPAVAPAPPVARAPTAVSCGDAGVILRGPVADTRRAGPAKEAVIATACLLDRWPADVLACIAGDGAPVACLSKLTAPQRTAYAKALAGWAIEFGEASATADR